MSLFKFNPAPLTDKQKKEMDKTPEHKAWVEGAAETAAEKAADAAKMERIAKEQNQQRIKEESLARDFDIEKRKKRREELRNKGHNKTKAETQELSELLGMELAKEAKEAKEAKAKASKSYEYDNNTNEFPWLTTINGKNSSGGNIPK